MSIIDKAKLKDSMGRPLTQSLFIDINYDPKFAVYTLKDEDHELNGVTYPSLKRLFLEMEDVVEYDFARAHLLGWNHWKRLNENKLLAPHFEQWREELELAVRAQAIKDIINLSAQEQGSFQAAKFLADRGWIKRQPGRPSKEEEHKQKKIQERIDEDFSADIRRLADYKKKG